MVKMTFTDKVAIVTGGAQGIGKSYCLELLKEGMKICLCDVSENAAEDFIKKLPENLKENIFFQKCDVTSFNDFKDAFDKTIERFGQINLVVNNAGIMNEQEWKKTIEVNMIGVIHGIQLAFLYMGTDNGGSGGDVINTSSRMGFKSGPFTPVYCATKYAVIGLTKSYGSDYHMKKTGIKVNAICPGPVNTYITQSSVSNSLNDAEQKRFLVSKTFIEPDELGKALIKILKDGGNGSLLRVDELGLQYV
ncbi:15-hydroxyprostaglandin dehydrogenase [NAD(+)] [Parasteatoda tepidariorum]|uniref:15-hydroxyprostaglandin dehydrogenase [NAD(+)] n=1 Tax=Parasteatoda tepidariorum TaxID=114398 RepID=UPI00077FC742|nr:15-hydroxyprostaglandin dehydrogenase [NAD(+)] [Parasteatoda tepidariorum]